MKHVFRSMFSSLTCCARFVCREVVGEGAEQQAAYLTPVPEGAVVYGSGSSSVILTKVGLACSTRCTFSPNLVTACRHRIRLPDAGLQPIEQSYPGQVHLWSHPRDATMKLGFS